MPLHGLTHHSRERSLEKQQDHSLSTLAYASQALAGVGNPASLHQQQQHHLQQQLQQEEQHLHPQPAQQPQQQHHSPQHHTQPQQQLNPRGPPGTTGLRVQTSNSGFPNSGIDSNQSSGLSVTPIYSGNSGLDYSAGPSSSTSESVPKNSIAFHLPSPNVNPVRSDSYHLPPQSSHSQHQQRHLDPAPAASTSTSSYQAYHPPTQSTPSSSTPIVASTRPPLATIATAPQAPSMHRSAAGAQAGGQGGGGGSSGNYNSSASLAAAQGDATTGRKYAQGGALTPTYPSSGQHQSSQSAGATHLGMGLSGMSRSTSSVREEPTGSFGAVSPGRWVSQYSMYAVDWCKWPVPAGQGYGRLAVGSYTEDSHNYIQILDTRPGPPDPHAPNAPTLEFVKLAEASHTYPITRVLWEPPSSKPLTELLATSGDHLRLWSLPAQNPGATANNSITNRSYTAPVQKLTPLALLSNSKSTDFTAPLTSLDWNVISPSLIITSSIDTTCTIWDIPSLTAKTQLIAHDKEVFDVRFMCNSVDVFASCGADGSVRMFDLRSLEHSTIIYEPGAAKASDKASAAANAPQGDRESGSPVNPPVPPALLRLAASPHDQHLIATFCTDSNIVRILDVRQPGQALVELKGHQAAVNCAEWNPGRRGVIAAGADDSEVLVWDIFSQSGGQSLKLEKGVEQERNPVAHWPCESEVVNLSWGPSAGKSGSDWLGVVGGRGVWGLAV